MNILRILSDFITEANNTNSTKDKMVIIKKYDSLKLLFKYVYDTTDFIYGVTSENIKKQKMLGTANIVEELNIFELLDSLNSREFTGHNAIKLINSFIESNKEYEDIIYNIIDRNLKIRIDSKILNKVFPGLIQEFSVALADVYDVSMNLDFSRSPYYASRKCDGVRCLTVFDEIGNIRFYSREGKEFLTLDKLKTDLLKLEFKSCVLDGELCIVDSDGNENFQAVMKEIRRKDHIIENPRYMIFDLIEYNDFYRRFSDRKLSDTYNILKQIESKCEMVKALDQILVDDNGVLEELITAADSLGWEGLIIRKCCADYEGKRSKNMLKIKKFHDQEYVVVGVEIGPMRHIVDGKEITSQMLTSVEIKHKGFQVNVGSGFTIEDRLYYKEHPGELIGKTITVKYFEETSDQNGNTSLRFPTIKAIFSGERNL